MANLQFFTSSPFGILFVQGFFWYIEDTDFRLLSSDNGTIHSWAAIDLKPTPLFRLMFKVSSSNDAPSTRIVDGQTQDGYFVTNPLLTNENLDFRLQISYAI